MKVGGLPKMRVRLMELISQVKIRKPKCCVRDFVLSPPVPPEFNVALRFLEPTCEWKKCSQVQDGLQRHFNIEHGGRGGDVSSHRISLLHCAHAFLCFSLAK